MRGVSSPGFVLQLYPLRLESYRGWNVYTAPRAPGFALALRLRCRFRIGLRPRCRLVTWHFDSYSVWMKSGHNQFMSEETEDIKTVADVWRGVFVWICSRLLLAFMFLLPFVLGCFVGGVALHDPDTCWLLALGRYIFQHHALPISDPFSYTFALQPGKSFVMYQWLSELVFYCAYLLSGLPGLLAFAALVLGQSFLVFPLRLASRCAPISLASLLTVIGVFASCFHYLVRPEIMSYILMSVCLVLLRKVYTAENSSSVQWRYVGAFFFLMLIWANAHSAFVLGLVLQLIILIVNCLQCYAQKREFCRSYRTAFYALLSSLLATFINPYGFGLWAYLPGLFFARFNYRIAELRPIQLSDLTEFTYYPFVFLVVLCLWIIIRAAVRARNGGVEFKWSNVVVIAICVFYGFKARRIIPFSVLMMIAQVSELWGHAALAIDSPARKKSFWSAFEANYAGIFNPSNFVWPITVAVLSIVGCFFTFGKVVAPTIPQGSVAFLPPTKVIDFLRVNKPSGNGFNDAQYGDMLIWYAPEIPVFIDTRYDMHGEQMASDYVSMMSVTGDWRALFERYKIDWIFVPASADIVRSLEADPQWSTVIRDSDAVVMSRSAALKRAK